MTAPGGPAADSPAGEPSPGRTREVAPGVIEVFLPLPSRPTIVNVWLLELGGGRHALVDTGTDLEASRTALATALAGRGSSLESVTTLVGTHHHPDHFGASAAIQEATGATTCLHPAELERVRYTLEAGAEDMLVHSRRHGLPIPVDQPVQAPRPAEVWMGTFRPTTRIDHELVDGEVLELGSRRVRVIATPGHTAGHCCLLDLGTGSLLVGDHLLPKITPHVGAYATGPADPLGDFIASMAKIAAVEGVERVCPAHGGVYRDHRHRARQLVAHHEYRAREMWDVIRAAPATAFEVARRAFAWVFTESNNRFQMGAAVMETIAHLRWLEASGRAASEERDGIVRFRGLAWIDAPADPARS